LVRSVGQDGWPSEFANDKEICTLAVFLDWEAEVILSDLGFSRA